MINVLRLPEYKKTNMAYTRLCNQCGQSFETFSKIGHVCKKCNSQKTKFDYTLTGYINKCKECGRKFTTYRKEQIYCDKECVANSKKLTSKLTYTVSKEEIFKRDSYKCVYCGKSSIEHGVILHLDHVYPINKGGKEDLFNLVTACERCNLKKHADILPEDIIKRIWARNEELNKQFDNKNYDDMIESFGVNLRIRKRRV